jgi:hypothetical protein
MNNLKGTTYRVTIPIHMMESQIIKMNREGWVVIKSEITDDKIRLIAIRMMAKSGVRVEL